MDTTDIERFYRLMADHHHNRANKDREEARMVWDALLDTLKVIRELDGDPAALREFARAKAIELGKYLESQGARAA